MDASGRVISPSLSAQQTIALWASPKTSVGVWAPDFRTLAPFSLSDGAANSSVSYDFVCGAGTYTLDFTYLQGPNRGIYTIAIDGVNVGTVDAYLSGFLTVGDTGLAYAAMSTITGLGLAAGAHILKFTMGTKNVDASAYYGCVSFAVLTKTG